MDAKTLAKLIEDTIRSHRRQLNTGQVAEFCGLSEGTVIRWVTDSQKPLGGAVVIKLYHLFVAMGYINREELSRIERVNPYGAYLARLVGYSVITFKRAVEICNREDNAVLRAMRGESTGFMGDKPLLFTLEKLQEEYDAQLNDQIAMWQRKLSLNTAQTTASASTPAAAAPVVATPAPTTAGNSPFDVLTEQQKAEVFGLARRVNGIELWVRLATTQWTDEQRAYLRTLTTVERLFWLSRAIGQLCSARAFDTAKDQ